MNYDDVFSFESLLAAHMNARKGKRNKKDVIVFENNLSVNLWSLHDELMSGTYTVSGYNCFRIYEPKERLIQALQYKDRVVQHALCDNYLYPLLTKKFIFDNGACQKGKGTDFALKRLTKFFAEYYKENGSAGYILKADIYHYFPSIDHEILKRKLSFVVRDERFLKLIYMIIDSYEGENGKGIPMGNQTSQLFALFYLNALDHKIKERYHVRYYVRYMDDMVILSDSKQWLGEILSRMSSEVENDLCLKFNDKTQIIKMKNGVDFLGFHFYLTETGKVVRRLRTSSKKRYKKRIKQLRNDYNAGKIELEDVQKSLPGFKGHLMRGHTYGLMKSTMKDFVLKRDSSLSDKKSEKGN